MAKVDHLIVLMLENRSFDHMLGFLQHPNPLFEGLNGDEENIWDAAEDSAVVTSDADYTIDPGPGHSHEDAIDVPRWTNLAAAAGVQLGFTSRAIAPLP